MHTTADFRARSHVLRGRPSRSEYRCKRRLGIGDVLFCVHSPCPAYFLPKALGIPNLVRRARIWEKAGRNLDEITFVR